MNAKGAWIEPCAFCVACMKFSGEKKENRTKEMKTMPWNA